MSDEAGLFERLERLERLEARLAQVEDERAIEKLVASYGPLVDAGLPDEVAELWTTDGVYDVDELYMGSADEVRAMVTSDAHQGLIGRGAAHFLGPAHVTVTGDSARAVCHSLLVVHHQERYLVVRAGVNLFQLVRTPEGWRIEHRTTRALDGRAESRALLGRGVTGA
ncbi:nuclear transport factor 2 family protein [Nocardioides sp. GY 10113]|uniref:nuclear transport factor 2 family protein n=1 Tax=Nocardioides sp. GY 10113 TaxID=2569761 RepID=UPI0010A75470|nr:nuclear transport factor 2 family protein [Nocardioides sp. GY 10113]TIC85058.1 nuclear transport factor 2 family protein [Nocardioides sp. GY 10113]